MKTKMLLAGLLAVGLCGCTSDDLVNGVDSTSTVENVYMQFTLQTPTTRSQTTSGEDIEYVESDDGLVEVGQGDENTVNKLFVVLTQTQLTTGTEKIIATSEPDASLIHSAGEDEYVVTFSSDEIANIAGEDNVNVFVFCNPTQTFIIAATTAANAETAFDEAYTLASTKDANGVITEEDDTPWSSSSGFLMSNAYKHTITQLPSTFENYRSVATPYDMGEVSVERSVARFDYKDGSGNTNNPNTYSITDYDDVSIVLDDAATITLTDIALVNLSKSFYYLRRVSNDGKDTKTGDGFAYSGVEWFTPAAGEDPAKGNYVVDTDESVKNGYSGTDMSDYFDYDMTNTGFSDLNWESLKAIFDGTADKEETWNSGENHSSTKDDYYIWRYATENTIPSSTTNQKKGITTGIAFKGQIMPTEAASEDLQAAMTNGETIYVYENKLYGSWDMIEALYDKVEEGTLTTPTDYESSLISAYKEYLDFCVEYYNDNYQSYYDAHYADYYEDYYIENNGDEDAANASALEQIKTELEEAAKVPSQAEAHFTGYAPDDEGNYYAYYYYWNRHNDNDEPNNMGIMEFAVVRNNVYKLSVSQIVKYGHPVDNTTPDPDPEEPNNPDESEAAYVRLAVKILPWTVRINEGIKL